MDENICHKKNIHIQETSKERKPSEKHTARGNNYNIRESTNIETQPSNTYTILNMYVLRTVYSHHNTK